MEIIEGKTRVVVVVMHLGVTVVTEIATIIVTTPLRIATTITTIAIGATTTMPTRTKVTPIMPHKVPRATTTTVASETSEVVVTTRQRRVAQTTLNQHLPLVLRIAISSLLARIVRIWGVVEGPRGAVPLLLRRTVRVREADVSSNSPAEKRQLPTTPLPEKSAKTSSQTARTRKTGAIKAITTPSLNPKVEIEIVAVAVTTTNAVKVPNRPQLLSNNSLTIGTRAGVSVEGAAILRSVYPARTRVVRHSILRSAKITTISIE